MTDHVFNANKQAEKHHTNARRRTLMSIEQVQGIQSNGRRGIVCTHDGGTETHIARRNDYLVIKQYEKGRLVKAHDFYTDDRKLRASVPVARKLIIESLLRERA